ncbi:bacteriocin immunity protein [Treponema zioleckii]|uniref:bacteriocin immunity protein n=1 Tax=Treponema zioleckii TaxID=331680 RepID=UPI0018D7F0E4|nr:bacteriocin immunity protein [Treponema zioleckii]
MMSRKELIELVSKIMNCEGSESEIDKMIEVLKENVMNPEVINLIYYEENTPEEVVDKALAYKPIIL